MTARTIITCPGGTANLAWSIINSDPSPNHYIVIKDQNNTVLLASDYLTASGSIPVTVPTIPGNYIYTITTTRNNFGQLSDTEYVFLNVTQIFLSDVFVQNNPTDPGIPFTVQWTINAFNPQSDELVQVIVSVTSDQLSLPENNFQALYRDGEKGKAVFIAPNTVGVFPVIVTAISRFGCSDIKMILLQTGDGGLEENTLPIAGKPFVVYVELLMLLFYFALLVFVVFAIWFSPLLL